MRVARRARQSSAVVQSEGVKSAQFAAPTATDVAGSIPEAGASGTLLRAGAAVLTGVLLALTREPFDFSLLALVAPVPLLWSWRNARVRRAAWLAFTAGAVYHALLLWWVWLFGAVALVPFVAGLAVYWAAVGAGVAWLAQRGIRHPLVTAAVWVVGDALVARFPWGGLSWAEIGYSLADVSWARSLAGWGGVTLVTFVVVASADFLVDLGTALRAGAGAQAWRAGAWLGALVLVVLLANAARFEPEVGEELRFALLQGNDINRDLTEQEESDRVLPRQHFELAATLDGDYDLVVFPESSLDEDPRTDPWLTDEIEAVATRHSTAVLTNAVTDHPDGRAVNLNLMYDADGTLQGTYAKRHLVPFGEFVPFRDQLEPLISELDEIPRDFAPGDDVGMFSVAGHDIATVICFETAFGPLVRDSVREGAELLVVSTNNRSYERSAQTTQHVELSQMRAAETGRPVLHNSINGITAVIDHDGNVLDRSELFVNSVTEGRIATTTGQTPYVRYGEWVLGLSVLALVVLVLVAVVRERRTSVESGRRREDSQAHG